jgi:hypothetical protein
MQHSGSPAASAGGSGEFQGKACNADLKLDHGLPSNSTVSVQSLVASEVPWAGATPFSPAALTLCARWWRHMTPCSPAKTNAHIDWKESSKLYCALLPVHGGMPGQAQKRATKRWLNASTAATHSQLAPDISPALFQRTRPPACSRMACQAMAAAGLTARQAAP